MSGNRFHAFCTLCYSLPYMGEQEVDPHEPEPPFIYECGNCGYRMEAEHQPETCPECGGVMMDISVPRE